MKDRFIVLDEDKDFTGDVFEKEVDAVHRAKEKMTADRGALAFYVAEIIGEAKLTTPPVMYMRLPPPVKPAKMKGRKT